MASYGTTICRFVHVGHDKSQKWWNSSNLSNYGEFKYDGVINDTTTALFRAVHVVYEINRKIVEILSNLSLIFLV